MTLDRVREELDDIRHDAAEERRALQDIAGRIRVWLTLDPRPLSPDIDSIGGIAEVLAQAGFAIPAGRPSVSGGETHGTDVDR
jgi:hypothetical protein